jgi:hypothetical protein
MNDLLLEPEQKRKGPAFPILTDHTCGEACWEAREEVCRCSCGGANHGCLRDRGGVQPVRTAKIDGDRYSLLSVGLLSDVGPQCSGLIKALPPYHVESVTDYEGKQHQYRYFWRETDPGSPYRLKAASVSQVQGWSELTAWRENARTVRPYLLWKKL